MMRKMAGLILSVLAVIFVSFIPCFAVMIGVDPFFILQEFGKVQPMQQPDEAHIDATKEAKRSENTARVGMGLKTTAIIFPGYTIRANFNKGHGIAIDLFVFTWSSGAVSTSSTAYSVYYNKTLSESEKGRSYLSLGIYGQDKNTSVNPAVKAGFEIGEYRGNNWIIDVGWPSFLGVGYVYYI